MAPAVPSVPASGGQLQSDLRMAPTSRHSLSLCSPLVPTSETVIPGTSSLRSTLSPKSSDLEQGCEPISSSVATSTTNTSSGRCVSRELFTCMALSSIVIGLPIAIIIVLFNLPRFSARRDTRQQHYILLAFGFPFSLVVSVSVMYGIYRLVMRIRTGPDHSKYLQPRMSWRRFSRRLRGVREQATHPCPYQCRPTGEAQILSRGSSRAKPEVDLSDVDYHSDGSSESTEPKLFTLVTEMMSHQHQRDSHPPLPHITHLRPPLHQVFPEVPGKGQRRSIAHLDTIYSQSIEPPSRRFSHQHRLSPSTHIG